MRRIMLVVAYDGTNYCGWQLQPNGVTIEEVLNKALSSLFKEEITVIGASRTDSGVHAMGNVAVFDTAGRMPADKVCFALNQRLPEDIRIQSSREVPLSFHPRKANCTKTYEYKILNRKIDMPIGRLYSHFCYFDLDLEKMKQAAACLVGEHDFKSFCTVRTQAEETVRTIYSLELKKEGDLITLRISGSGFLYNMVRIIAGTLLKIGMGIWEPERMEEILEARDRTAAGPTIPAKGLTLISMEYEKELKPMLEGENRHWHYLLDQRKVAGGGEEAESADGAYESDKPGGDGKSREANEKTAVLHILRCEDGELEGLVRRMVHQAYRNGAKRILVRDGKILENESTGGVLIDGRGRFREGQRFGFYVLKKAEGEFWEAVYDGNGSDDAAARGSAGASGPEAAAASGSAGVSGPAAANASGT